MKNGFSIIEIILVIAVVGLIGLVGWLFVDRLNHQKSDDTSSNTQSNNTQTKAEDNSEKVDTTVHAVSLTVETIADVDKMPNYTPDSFKTYLKNEITNYVQTGDVKMHTKYTITKISSVNVLGGVVAVDDKGEAYPGGAGAVWGLTTAGAWHQMGMQAVPACSDLSDPAIIYSEFISECMTDGATADLVANPNGSITKLSD